MTPLQQKINVVEQYIYHMKGVRINITFKKNVNNQRELDMLDQAYIYAVKYFSTRH